MKPHRYRRGYVAKPSAPALRRMMDSASVYAYLASQGFLLTG